MVFIKIKFIKKFNTIAIKTIFNLSFTFHILASIFQFICSKKLNARNNIEYFNIIADSINFGQKSMIVSFSANTKNNIEKAIDKTKKFF